MRLFRFVLLLAFAMIAAPMAGHLYAKDKDKDKDHGRPRRGTLTTFGPVALGSTHGLRLCHANHFGDKSITVEWVFVAVAPPNPTAPPVGEPTKIVGRIAYDLAPETGNCAEFAPDLTQHPEGVSIIAVLIGLLKDGRTTTEVVASAQLTELGSTGGGAIGLLLPAVQKRRVPLPPAIP